MLDILKKFWDTFNISPIKPGDHGTKTSVYTLDSNHERFGKWRKISLGQIFLQLLTFPAQNFSFYGKTPIFDPPCPTKIVVLHMESVRPIVL